MAAGGGGLRVAFTPSSFESFSREVGATEAEFARSLQQALPGGVEVLGGGQFRVRDGEVCLHIAIMPGAVRRIGLFALPVLAAQYRFESGAQPDRAALIARLDRAMQRGGG